MLLCWHAKLLCQYMSFCGLLDMYDSPVRSPRVSETICETGNRCVLFLLYAPGLVMFPSSGLHLNVSARMGFVTLDRFLAA